MAAPQLQKPQTVYTEDEYFQWAEAAEERWEFLPCGYSLTNGNPLGTIEAMSGGTPYHSIIAINITRTLGDHVLPKGCHIFGSDLRIHTGDGVYTYPDVSVVCGKWEFFAQRSDTITNPILIVEVLSESTKKYDMGGKFAHYQSILSLMDYILVFQNTMQVILHSRIGDHWETRIATGKDSSIWLPCVETTLALSEIYAFVEFEADSVAD
jgi:Uma2 family endonuclease